MRKKIIIRMSAGLANRMFQYSYYLYLKKKGYNVYLDNTYKPLKWKMEEIDWSRIFPNAPIDQAPKNIIYLLGGGYDIVSKVRRHYIPITCNVLMPDTFSLVNESKFKKNYYIAGAFQNSSMVASLNTEVSEVFKFMPFVDGNNFDLYKKIKHENSVSIHIRKGKDYLANVAFQGTCKVSYYEEAVDHVKSKVTNPIFYIFTDNKEWVINNIKSFNYKIIDWNPAIGWGNHYDMQLMSFCKHNIISNSTYSWWGAWLNSNPDKICIGPIAWFNPLSKSKYLKDEFEIIPESWIKL